MHTANTQVKTLVLWLIDRADSDFVREGTENTPLEDRLNSPSDYRLPSESYVIEKERNADVQKQIRYIYGSQLIFVEDQERANVKPNDINDVIWFKNGKLVVSDTPEDKGLFNYLSRCAWNRDAPNRPPRVKPIFFVEDKADDAEKELVQRSYKLDAMSLVQSLSDIKAGKIKYNETKIDFLCNLLNISTALTPAEKCNCLMDIAEEDPATMIDSVANKTNEYRAAINEAIIAGVISIDGDQASFMDSKQAFLQFSNKDKVKRVDEMLSFMLSSPEGELAYKQMTIELTAKKGVMALSV